MIWFCFEVDVIVVLFGLAGVGKNFVGQLLAQETQSHFWDADEAITDEMQHCIDNKISLSQEIRDRYFDAVMARAAALQSKHRHVIIAQAFYRNKNRQDFIDRFSDIVFVHVEASLETIMQRLKARNNMIDGEYANRLSVNFEKPEHLFVAILNEASQDKDVLLEQLRSMPQLSSLYSNSSAQESKKLSHSFLFFYEKKQDSFIKTQSMSRQEFARANSPTACCLIM